MIDGGHLVKGFPIYDVVLTGPFTLAAYVNMAYYRSTESMAKDSPRLTYYPIFFSCRYISRAVNTASFILVVLMDKYVYIYIEREKVANVIHTIQQIWLSIINL